MKTYKRPMDGWWTRNPFYLWYMFREASCVFITAYALVLLWGLWRLKQGETAFENWLENLSTPVALVFHAVTLILVIYHSWTWFKIMPKTLPFVRLGGKRVPDPAIVISGVAATVVVSIVLFWLARP